MCILSVWRQYGPNANVLVAISNSIVDSKTFHQQNPPVLNWVFWLMQVVLYNTCKTGCPVITAVKR